MSSEFYEVKQTITCVEDMPPVARDIIKNYCDVWGFDEFNLTPNVWRDVLTELRIKLFEPCKYTYVEKTTSGGYDIPSVEWIYNNIYKRICDMHNKECSIHGFVTMVGIGKDQLYRWQNGEYLSGRHSDLLNIISDDNEDSLFCLMQQIRNPVGVLAKLNKNHGWNLPGAGRTNETKPVISASSLPTVEELQKIDQPGIEQNTTYSGDNGGTHNI